jgi:hypothetical protein
MKKICRICHEEKTGSEFPPRKDSKDGLFNHCKECQKKRGKAHYEKNKAKYIERSRQQRLKNPKASAEYQKEYREANAKTLLEKSKAYRLKNKERIAANRKKYAKESTQKIAEWQREYREKNKLKLREYSRKYVKHKRSTDIEYNIKCNLRSRICNAVSKGYKSKPMAKLVGCSVAKLRKYLESQFTEGMTWDNYGVNGWHIDHIRPCASFDLKEESEQMECFHYSNLQPLWAEDNLKKSDKWDNNNNEKDN